MLVNFFDRLLTTILKCCDVHIESNNRNLDQDTFNEGLAAPKKIARDKAINSYTMLLIQYRYVNIDI